MLATRRDMGSAFSEPSKQTTQHNNRTELTAASLLVFEGEVAMLASVFSAAAAHPDRWAA
jgi:hypothetical protein